MSGPPSASPLPALAAASRLAWLARDELFSRRPDFAALPFAEASRRGVVPLRAGDSALWLALADPFDTDTRQWAEHRVGEVFDWRLADAADLRDFLAHHQAGVRALDAVERREAAGGEKPGAAGPATVPNLSLDTLAADDSPVVRLVGSTLYDAVHAGASDIHLETGAAGLALRYRLDGVLVPVGAFAGSDFAERVISRVKVLADLDIAERRVPQDGRFRVAIDGRAVDFRVSVMPSVFGEDAVLRILDRQTLADRVSGLTLDALGLDADARRRIRALARAPHGMLLVTGPTGSGKTTTLYATLGEINQGRDKIVTIEDPVEYQLPGVLQIPVNEKKGLSFSRGLRSILRHDPDIILVGEIRDAETAQIAVQASLTGHLVFTTVHANNVFDVLGRSLHMELEPYAFVSAINGIVAQRLIRRVCADCGRETTPDDELLAASGLTRADVAGWHFVAGRGCATCRHTGYRGRKAIAEILELDDELREMIFRGEPVRKLREAARQRGTRFLRDAALACVRDGETTLDEINRVTVAG